MDRPFYYLRPEDVVPRDAVHIIIGGAITVVPPEIFEDYLNLARVELQEGVEVIGGRAFANCPNLTFVNWPSSLREIGEEAFAYCDRLTSEVILPEGFRWIGSNAFCGCAVKKITVPSSVAEIGTEAFAGAGAWALEVNLPEGLETIGKRAFKECGLRQITIPSSAAEIGAEAFSNCVSLETATLVEGLRWIKGKAFHGSGLKSITIPSSVEEIVLEAFADCEDLCAVTLAGGMVSLDQGAFNCPLLERIIISSMAIVVEAGEDGDGLVTAVAGGIEWDPENKSTWLFLASPHLAAMRSEELRSLTYAISQIASARGAGMSDLSDEDSDGASILDLSCGEHSGPIREGFANQLSTWHETYKREVATILELGLWKIELERTREPGSRETGRGKRTRANVPTRDDCRRTCGADPIVGLVLSSLAGPHRRADQSQNE